MNNNHQDFEKVQANYKVLFDKICDSKNWKNPINCVIPKETYKAYNEAVQFFTGGKLKVISDNGKFCHCQANGYYIDCGA